MSRALAYKDADAPCSSSYLWEKVMAELDKQSVNEYKIFDLGCGNGAFSRTLVKRGYTVCGVDPSESGIAIAKRDMSEMDFRVGSAYDPLHLTFGRFPYVVSLEVIEHCYYPRKFAQTIFDLLEPGGTAFISTPYHGYLKNLAISLFGRWDSHWSPLWDGGHIKMFSELTLRKLLEERGFEVLRIVRCGRFGPLAKSMIAVVTKPNDEATSNSALQPSANDLRV